MIETIEVNVVEVQGIWDEEYEILKSVVAIWGILLKGVTELKKRVLEGNVENITRSGKHYKKDHPGRNIGEGSKPTEVKGKEEKEEEDWVLTQLKKTQAHVFMWGLLMASHKHRSAFLDALNGKKCPLKLLHKKYYLLWGLRLHLILPLPFPMKNSLL